MKVTRTNQSPTKVSLAVSADQYDLTPIKDHVLTHFAESVRVPGFRVGTAPPALIERQVDPNTLANEFMEHALNSLYGRAVQEEKLRPAGNPEIKIKKFVPFTDLEFEAEVEVIGPIKLADYKKTKLTKPKIEISIKEVNDVLGSLVERAAERKESDRPSKEGDELIVDFAGHDKGGPIANTDGKDVPVILGSGNFVPGFETALVGLKAGEKKDFEVTFPADYGAKLMQNRQVTFTAEVKKVTELVEPKLDDDFAKKVGPFKTLSELKADIKKQLKAEKETQAARQYENDLVLKLTEKSVVEVPKKMVDEQIIAAEENEKKSLLGRGQTWQEHLAEEAVTEQQHRERNRADIATKVKAGIVLSEIADNEAIEVTSDEVETRVNLLKAQYTDEKMRAELDKPENQRQIASEIMTEKTVAKLAEYAGK